jgi:hypothetical protein
MAGDGQQEIQMGQTGISPSVEALSKVEWKSNLPDARMQVIDPLSQSPDGQLTPEQIRLRLEMQNQLMGYKTSSIETFCTRLGFLNDPRIPERSSDPEKLDKEKLRKELQESYEESLSQALGVNEQIFDLLVDRNHSAYPYYNSSGESFYTAVQSRLDEAKNAEQFVEGSESAIRLKRFQRDMEWAQSSFRASVALSASSPAYFDVVLQLQTLKQQREIVLTDDFESIYADKLPGLEFGTTPVGDQGDTEISIVEKNKIGIRVPEKYTEEYGFPKEMAEGKVGLRELAVKLQDDCMAWRMRVAAASQFDYSKPPSEKSSFMGTKLKDEERQLINLVLGESSEKDGIQTFTVFGPCSADAKSKVQKKISAAFQALLRTNAFDRTQQIIKGGGDSVAKTESIKNLSIEVNELSQKIQDNWKAKENDDPVARLSKLVTRMGYLQDYSLLTSHDYCWSFIWERNNKGDATADEKEWHVKKLEIGGINGPSGDAWSLNWARRKHVYDQNGNSSASEMLPTDREGRKEVSTLPLNEMPKYIDLYGENLENHPDEYLVRQWNFLFSDEPKWKAERAAMGFSDIPPSVKDKLKEWAFVWKTCYNAKFVGDGDYKIEIPHFVAPDLPVANMWNTISTEKDETEKAIKIIHGGKSVWQDLIDGGKMSKIKWDEIDQKEVDRWLVDCDMASRYMRIFIEVVDKERDPMLSELAGHPGTGALKELAKRIRLSLRDSPESPPTVQEVAIIPWIITLVTANKYNISAPQGWMTNPEDKSISKYPVDRFREEMAAWKRAFRWLPSDRPGLDSNKLDQDFDYENLSYGDAMALIAEFYERLFLRMGKASAEEAVLLVQNNYKKSTENINKEEFFSKGSLHHKFPVDTRTI